MQLKGISDQGPLWFLPVQTSYCHSQNFSRMRVGLGGGSFFICMSVRVCPNQNPFISSDTVASSHCLFPPLYPSSFLFASQYLRRRFLPSQSLCFIIHPFHPSSSIALNISLFTSFSFWQCLINMLAAGSKKKKRKNCDKHQTHAPFLCKAVFAASDG